MAGVSKAATFGAPRCTAEQRKKHRLSVVGPWDPPENCKLKKNIKKKFCLGYEIDEAL
jgi:hypothetical protein